MFKKRGLLLASMFVSRRFHVVVDACDCDPKALVDKAHIENIIRTTALMCDMKILHGPVIIEGVPENPGVTGFAIIDFSHISVHTFSENNEICVDIFSCKPFDYGDVKEFVRKSFGLREESTRVVHIEHK